MSQQELIERRIDKDVTGGLTVSSTGGLAFTNVNEMMEVAKLMSLSQVAVPKHLRENPGACLAVIIQAASWGMSPFAVANKSYSVNDRISYESQMVNAVILNRAPIKGRIKYAFEGEGPTRKCIVSVETLDGETITHPSPLFRDIKVKNSPLWTQDPDQQLAYYTSRAMCRRHFPDVLLGVYTPEEMNEEMRDVTPDRPQSAKERLQARLATQTPETAENAPESPTGTKEEAPAQDDPLPFAETTVMAPEDQSQDQQEPEVDETFTDWMLSIDEMTTADELTEAFKQAHDFENVEQSQAAIRKVKAQGERRGLTYSSKVKQFIKG